MDVSRGEQGIGGRGCKPHLAIPSEELCQLLLFLRRSHRRASRRQALVAVVSLVGGGGGGRAGVWSGGGAAHHLYGHHADVEGGALPLLLHCRLLRHLRSTDGRLDNRGAQAQEQTRKSRH